MRAPRLTALIARVRAALSRDDGSLAESVASVVLITLVASAVAVAATNDLTVIGQSTATSERQNAINSIVGQHNDTSINWGTPAAPVTKSVTLASGVSAQVTTWAATDPTGTTYFASIPRTGDALNQSQCQLSTATNSANCLVATQYATKTVSTLIPAAVVRKDPSGVGTTGTVNAAVATSTPIAQDGQIATFTPPGSGSIDYRYLVKAQDTQGAQGSIRIVQGGVILASIPTDNTMHDYYGTIVATAGTPVTVAVGVDTHIVSTILIYQAG